MADPKQLLKVLDMAQKKADKLGLELRQARSAQDALAQQMKQLQAYRLDYVQQAQQQSGSVLNISKFQQFNYIIAKLDASISQHLQKQQQAEQQVAEKQQIWMAARQRQQALKLLIENTEKKLQTERSRREQRNLDEYATQLFVRRKRSGK